MINNHKMAEIHHRGLPEPREKSSNPGMAIDAEADLLAFRGIMPRMRERATTLASVLGYVAIGRRWFAALLIVVFAAGTSAGTFLERPVRHWVGSLMVSAENTWTECRAENVQFVIDGGKAHVTGRFFIRCAQNPQGEIDHVLLATGNRVLYVMYSGRPGHGDSGQIDAWIPLLKSPDGHDEPIYLVRMATVSVQDAIHCYEAKGEHGWRTPIWPVRDNAAAGHAHG